MEYVDLRPVVNDAQGKVWAVAPMLPEGSQSWSMRLVGGADLDGADTRATQYGVKRGNLVLADNHYGMYGFDAPGNFLWTQQGADDIGMPLAGRHGDRRAVHHRQLRLSVSRVDARTCPTTAKAPRIIWRLPRPRASACCAPAPATWTCWPAATCACIRCTASYRRRLVGRHPGRRPVQPAAPEGLAGTVTNDPSQGFEPYVNGGAQSVYRAWYPDGGGT